MTQKEQSYLNQAIYDKGTKTLDDIEKEKPKKYSKKELGYNENIVSKLFNKKKTIKKKELPKKENKETSLGKKSYFDIFKKKKKEMSFFNDL